MKHRRNKFLNVDGGGAVASTDKPEPLISDQHPEDLDQQMVDGSDGTSVYLALFRRDWSARQTSSPLYKLQVADPDSNDPAAPSPDRETLHRTCNLETDMGGKTFVTLKKSGWILGVGGDPGGAIIFDTKTGNAIRGPELVARKLRPVVVVVGNRIYALSANPDYLRDPDFVPWFEVLDLPDDPVVTETEEGVLRLDAACAWKALPCPVFFPHLLTPMEFRDPPYITVRSSVVVGPYILVSLNQPSNCVFAFDTDSGQWHKIAGEYLPFVGAATPRRHAGDDDDIFLAFSREEGPIKAYRIRASATSSIPPSEEGSGVELSITAMIVRNKEHLEVGVGGRCCYVSLGREHSFSVLFWQEGSGRYLVYDKETEDTYPRKLYLKLVTYRTEIPVLEGKTPEIVVSGQEEQTFKVCSSLGFSPAPIAFALSI